MSEYPAADMSSSVVDTKRRRFGEPAKFVPVIFVVFTIAILYSIFVFCHCMPLLQIGAETVAYNHRRYGVLLLTIFHAITVMLIVCYVLSILVHPGEVPDGDPQWEYVPMDVKRTAADAMSLNLQETKRSGDRRHCKWCGKFKPDRCHHCRVCRCCILKMDHHCPWIYNCVGFMNYKYFFLLLFYSMLALHVIIWSMAPSVVRCAYKDTRFLVMFLVLFGETLSIFLGALVSMFWCFHIWLMLKGMTTIEFCEKSLPKKGGSKSDKPTYDVSIYNVGFSVNVKAVLGPNLLLALLPLSPPLGDGLNFVSAETRLTKNLEVAQGTRRRTHQRTQRSVHRASRGQNDNVLDASDEVLFTNAVPRGIDYGSTDGLLAR